MNFKCRESNSCELEEMGPAEMQVSRLNWHRMYESAKDGKVRFGPVLQCILENPEPDYWFGPLIMSNLGPDRWFGPKRSGSGS